MFDITDRNFSEEIKTGLVLVEFSADWCTPCRIQTMVLKELKQELGDKVKIYKMNVDENVATPQDFGIMSIPTLIIKKDGKMVEKLVGSRHKEMLLQTLQAYF